MHCALYVLLLILFNKQKETEIPSNLWCNYLDFNRLPDEQHFYDDAFW